MNFPCKAPVSLFLFPSFDFPFCGLRVIHNLLFHRHHLYLLLHNIINLLNHSFLLLYHIFSIFITFSFSWFEFRPFFFSLSSYYSSSHPQTTFFTSILILTYYLIFLYSSPSPSSPHDSFSTHPTIFITIISISLLLLYHRFTVFWLLLLPHLHLQFLSHFPNITQTYQLQRLN